MWVARVAVATTTATVCAAVIGSATPIYSPWELICLIAVSVPHIEVGLRLWRVREDSSMGHAADVAGLCWLAEGLGRALWPGLFADSLLLCVLYQPVLR
jgi:hypothetical protein